MAGRPRHNGARIGPALILGAGAWWLLEETGPVLRGAGVAPVPALAAVALAACGFAALSDALRLAADMLDWIKAWTPRGHKGTARWARSPRDLGGDIRRTGWGPYWGAFKGREVIADYASNALTLGPAGTGKGVGVIQPTILAIRHSKTVIDFKGELACVLAGALRRRGETVRILNIGDMWLGRLGPSDAYNPLHLIADDFERPGGLQDVTNDLAELALQLLPEPEGGDARGERYFRDGSRTFIAFAVQTCVLIDGLEATLGDVARMLDDRRSLYRHALWACGRLAQTGERP